MVLMTLKESIMIFGKYLSTFPDVNPRFLPEKAQSKILWILERDFFVGGSLFYNKDCPPIDCSAMPINGPVSGQVD